MSTGNDRHLCLLCQQQRIAMPRALCGECFPFVPWRVRAELLHAWRFRATSRRRYENAYIALRQWVNEFQWESR